MTVAAWLWIIWGVLLSFGIIRFMIMDRRKNQATSTTGLIVDVLGLLSIGAAFPLLIAAIVWTIRG